MAGGFITRTRALIKHRGIGRVTRYAFETAFAYLTYGFFRLMPLDCASAIGGATMRWLGPKMIRTRKVVLPQLQAAFPEKSEQERREIMRMMWDNIGRVFAEYSHLDTIMSRVEVVGRAHLEAARDSNRPLIFVTGHMGNWEIAPITVQSVGIHLHVIYRAPNNVWVESLLQRVRRAGSGDRMIAKGAAGARKILSVMRTGGAIGILADQKLGGAPLIPFFGRAAHTVKSVPVFASKFKARVHYVCVERLAGAHFRATVGPEIDVGTDERAYLVAMNAELESWVRAQPAQWLWTHRRWTN